MSDPTSQNSHDAPCEGEDRDAVDVCVIIVSFNTCDLTLTCLRHLHAALDGVTSQVIVVDNASQDGSVEAVAERFPQVELVASDRNLGFGAANNVGMRRGAGRYVLLLNSDAFVEPTAIGELIDYLENHPQAAMVGPKLLNADGSTQRSCFRYPTPARAWLENTGIARLFKSRSRLGDYRNWAHDEAGAVDWAVGACLLVRRQVIDQVGGFDERFFMYAEETDWQKRIRDAGWTIHFTPEARVTHLGGASGASDRAGINAYFFTSLDLYQSKHYGLMGLICFRGAMVVGALLRLPGWAVAYAVRPRCRAKAAGRMRRYAWLIYRQLFYWPATAITSSKRS